MSKITERLTRIQADVEIELRQSDIDWRELAAVNDALIKIQAEIAGAAMAAAAQFTRDND